MLNSVSIAAGLLFCSVPVVAQTADPVPVVLPGETILRVSGEGSVRVQPEIMSLEIGVTTTASSAKEALLDNNERSVGLIEQIRATGIRPNEIQTTDLDVGPVYSENDDEDRITGWRATNTLTVTTNRIAQAGEMVLLMFEAGGNTLESPAFELTKATRRKVSREAEADALADARAQADSVAVALGMRVSRILLVSDSRVNFTGSGGYITVTGSRIKRTATPIEPGDITVTAMYNVEYALASL